MGVELPLVVPVWVADLCQLQAILVKEAQPQTCIQPYLDMQAPLLATLDLICTFYEQQAAWLQHSERFLHACLVEI